VGEENSDLVKRGGPGVHFTENSTSSSEAQESGLAGCEGEGGASGDYDKKIDGEKRKGWEDLLAKCKPGWKGLMQGTSEKKQKKAVPRLWKKNNWQG